MSHTKTAIAALLTLTGDRHAGPEWLQMLVALVQMVSLVYVLWFIWRGPEPVERAESESSAKVHVTSGETAADAARRAIREWEWRNGR